ncbi:hypothetical protein [Halostella pelagica]|uniref:hypothetical protein n=1 Tax=Halostella pelagica TaxID=2583824 RepID=UPI0013866A54|nr:hypothetical protein [Halostella pelagica]
MTREEREDEALAESSERRAGSKATRENEALAESSVKRAGCKATREQGNRGTEGVRQ